eukprot:4905775-Amphidinium_carterae.1
MVAGRCRRSTAALVKNSCDGFRRSYPNFAGEPDHTDLEYYSFLRDTQSVYPHPWVVPDWFRAGTLYTAAEEVPAEDLRVAGHVVPAFRKT